jgi:tripartite-type tricarboxylate transporter receptor subunit TctC
MLVRPVGWLGSLIVVALLALSGGGWAPSRAEDAATFAGKTIKIVVGMPPGGGVDAYARLVQRHLGRYLPGSPLVIVQNMPGAGSMRSVMSLAAAPDDGTAIVTFSSSLLTESILFPERVKIDFRAYGFLGNLGEDGRICFVRPALGVRDIASLRARGRLVFGATAAGTSGNVDAAMLRNLFGLDVQIVNGYAGSAAKRLAFERGEIDGDCGGVSSLPSDWLPTGKIAVFMRLAPELSPGLDPAVPFGGALLGSETDRRAYDFLVTPQRLGRLFITSGKTNPARLAALREAFGRMMADPKFLADAGKISLNIVPSRGEDVGRDIAALYATPRDILARARSAAGE